MPEPALHRRIASAALFPALLFLIVAAFYWKLTLTRQFDWIWGPDLANQVLPWFQVQAEQWHQHRFPLWDPYLWAGQPLLGQAQPGGAYPLNWILFLMPLHNGKIALGVLQWYFVVIHWMAAVFCYCLCRDLGRSRAASLIGGCIFTFSSYMATTGWPQMINGVVWAPLVFLFQLRALEGRRPLPSAVASGAFLGVSWLSGHHQVPIFLTLAWAAIWLFHIFRHGRPHFALVKLAALGGVFMLLTGALQILPALEYGRLALRWAGAADALHWNESVPYYVHARYALFPHGLLGIVFPALHDNANPYVGIVAFALALLGIACCWRERWTPLFAALVLFSLVYALGPHSVFQGFLYAALPEVEKARVPSVAVFLSGLGIAVLASRAVDSLARGPVSPWPRRAVHASLVFGLLTFAILFAVYAAHDLNATFDDAVLITAFSALLLAALLHAWRTGNLTRDQGATLALLLVLFELGNPAQAILADRSDKNLTAWLDRLRGNADIAEFLHRQPGSFRIAIDDPDVPLDWSEWNGLATMKGMTASVTTNVAAGEFDNWQSRLLAGIRYTIARKPKLADDRDVFTAAGGLKVYESPTAFPLAWAVHRLAKVPNADAGRALVWGHLFELHDMAFSQETVPTLPSCAAAGETVSLHRLPAGGADLAVRLNCASVVVLSDTFYPGWKAAVDGRSTRIYEVDGYMRGVLVPSGAHTVALRYRPLGVYAGAALTLLGLLGALAFRFLPLTYAAKAGTIQSKNVF